MNEFILVTIAGTTNRKAIKKDTVKSFKEDVYSEADKECVKIEYLMHNEISWVKVNESFDKIIEMLY